MIQIKLLLFGLTVVASIGYAAYSYYTSQNEQQQQYSYGERRRRRSSGGNDDNITAYEQLLSKWVNCFKSLMHINNYRFLALKNPKKDLPKPIKRAASA